MVIPSSMKKVSSMSGTSHRSPAVDRRVLLEALRKAYLFGFAISTVIHVAALSISLASILTPGMFATGYLALLRPSRVFIPVSLFSTVQVSSIGEGALYFLQWDDLVGSTALGCGQRHCLAMLVDQNSAGKDGRVSSRRR